MAIGACEASAAYFVGRRVPSPPRACQAHGKLSICLHAAAISHGGQGTAPNANQLRMILWKTGSRRETRRGRRKEARRVFGGGVCQRGLRSENTPQTLFRRPRQRKKRCRRSEAPSRQPPCLLPPRAPCLRRRQRRKESERACPMGGRSLSDQHSGLPALPSPSNTNILTIRCTRCVQGVGSSGTVVEPSPKFRERKEQEGRPAPPPSERGVARP